MNPATKRWEDRSTTKEFQFVFFCDCCQQPILSPVYRSESGFRTKLLISRSERRARELIWQRDHESAYERANLDMLQNHLHRCEICGEHICGDCAYVCTEMKDGVCCEACLIKHGYHGIRVWEGE